MADAGSQIIANRRSALIRLKTAMESAQTSFPIAELSMEGPDDTLLIASESDLVNALEASRPQDLRAGRTLVGPHRVDLAAVYAPKGVAAKQCSTGEQKALLLSLILGNARALAEDFGAPPIILLDEVAAHLDSDRRAALYDEVCGLKAQAFMTGTGEELFSELAARAQHYEISEKEGSSVLMQVGE
jgi:DNA replication and repair protein RecF